MVPKAILIFASALGAFCVYNGMIKISPNVDADRHVLMKKHFVNYARIAPLKKHGILWLQASEYRSYLGGMEIAGGCGLIALTGRATRTISYILLLVAAAFMCHSYQTLGDRIDRYLQYIAVGILTLIVFFVERTFNTVDVVEEKSEKKESKKKTKKDN